MDNKFLMAALVGSIVNFAAGFVIYGLLLAGFLEANMNGAIMVDPPNWIWLVISTVLGATMLAYIFSKWANISTWKTGAQAGAILGFFVQGAIATGLFSMTTMYTGGITAMLVDIVGGIVMLAITGAAVGFMLGRGSD